MHQYSVAPANKVKGNKGGHFSVQGTIMSWSDNVGSLCFGCQKQCKYSSMNVPYFVRDNWQIFKKVHKWTTQKAAKSLANMQGNKVYMLTNKKSGNLVIVGYSDIVSARCVDIKVSTLSYILTLAYGAISWKSSRTILLASVIWCNLSCGMLRG